MLTLSKRILSICLVLVILIAAVPISGGGLEVFASDEPITATGLEVITPPDTFVYDLLQTVNTTGLTLRLNYSDGSHEDIASGFTCDTTVLYHAGKQAVTVSYEGFSASFDVYAAARPARTVCSPAGTVRYQGFDYAVTWEQAKVICEELGGHLATITSAEEQALVNECLTSAPLERYSIGATDVESEGVWKWITGETFSYSNWAGEQPDNTGVNEHFLQLYADAVMFSKWNDVYGTMNMGFICEFEDEYVPEKTIIHDGHIYSLHTHPTTWTNAKEICETLGGHLATVTSVEEQEVIEELITHATQLIYWLGASDAGEEGTWTWVTGETFSYNNWASEQPDDKGSVEHYASILPYCNVRDNPGDFGLWFDEADYYVRGFICEIELNNITPDKTENLGCNKYELYQTPLGWHDAKAYAESKGGHLVTISNENEQALIESLLSDLTNCHAWIGMTDEDKKGEWKWLSGDTVYGPSRYLNWAEGEPSNYYVENYGHIYNDKIGLPLLVGKWNNCMANRKYAFIVEYDGIPLYYDLNYDSILPNRVLAPTACDGWTENADGIASLELYNGIRVVYDSSDGTFTFDNDGEIVYGEGHLYDYALKTLVQEGDYVTIFANWCSGSFSGRARPVIDVFQRKSLLEFIFVSPRSFLDVLFNADDQISNNSNTEYYSPYTSQRAEEAKRILFWIWNKEGVSFNDYKFRPLINISPYPVNEMYYSQAGKRIAPSSTYGELAVPTREGYIFDGWYTSPEGGERITSETVMTGNEAKMVYAHWSPEYMIEFNPNGGECSVDSMPNYYGSPVGELPVPTREGFRFLGWYTRRNGGTVVTPTDVLAELNNVTLYALWTDAVDFNCGVGLTWELDGNTLKITGTGDMADYVAAGAPWASLRTYITSVEIASGVTGIGDYALYNLSLCGSVAIPATVARFGEGAFSGCMNLKSIGIPDKVTVLEDYVFENCAKLQNLILKFSLTYVAETALDNCNALASITVLNPECTLPEYWMATSEGTVVYGYSGSDAERFASDNLLDFESIGRYGRNGEILWVFTNSTGLLSVTGTGAVPNYTVGGAPWYSFASMIEKASFGEGITYIGDNALSGCVNTVDISVPLTLDNVGVNVFEDTQWYRSRDDGMVMVFSILYSYKECPDGNNIILNSGMSRISRNLSESFRKGGESPASLQISHTVVGIDDGALSNAAQLTTLTVHPGNKHYKAVDNILFSKDGTQLVCCPAGRRGSISVPKEVTTIRPYAFYGCTGLTELTLDKSVTSIGDDAFTGTSLHTIRGYYGSYAHTFALEKGYTFIPYTSTVTYDCNYENATPGSVVDVTVNTGCAIGSMYTVSQLGYEFLGWYLETDTEDIQITPEFIVDGDMHIYAYWSKTPEAAVHITGITVGTMPAKTSYYTGEPLQTSGLTLSVNYSNGTTRTASDGFECIPAVLNSAGTQEVSVYYAGMTCTYEVEVTAVVPTRLSITPPTALKYYVTDNDGGDDEESAFNPRGLVATVSYNNGVSRVINDTSVFEYLYDFSSVSNNSRVNVNYTENGGTVSAFFEVEVFAKPQIYSEPQSATAGGRISVPVKISGNTGIMGYEITVEYDPSLITPEIPVMKTATGVLDSDLGYGEAGKLKVVWYDLEQYTGNGELFVVNFRVNGTVPTCQTNILLTYGKNNSFDEEYTEVRFSCTGTTVSLTESNASLIYAEQLTATAGEYVDIPILCVNNIGIAEDTYITLTFDTNSFSYASTNANGIATIIKSTPQVGKVKVVLGELASSAGNGVLFTIRLNISPTASGSKLITLENDCDGWSCNDINIEVVRLENTVVISANPFYSNNGKSISVPVNVSANSGIMGYKLALGFDTDTFTISRIIPNSAWGGNFDYIINPEGTVDIIWNSSDSVTLEGVLFTVELAVKNTPQACEKTLSLLYSENDTYNEEWNNVELDCTPITANITRYGDVTGDNTINALDAMFLELAYSGHLSPVQQQHYMFDMNNDGDITLEDFSLLLRMVVE